MKEDFFSKFKDYNRELEKILEHKDFSQDAKNLLLSMFYKLEASYQDYYTVKRHCKTKQEYLEKILDNVKVTNSIQLVKSDEFNFEELKEKGLCEVDLVFKRIIVISNEFALLKAILELNNFQIRLKDEYSIIKNSMPYLLNMAYDMENSEVIRDFNAWSWNTLVEEIKDIKANLIYQNLRIALNTDIFSKVEELDIDIIKQTKQILLDLYDEQVVQKFLELIFVISVIMYIKQDEEEKKALLEEKNRIQDYLEKINDKKNYICDISEDRKKLAYQLKKIDLIINNKELLLQEYERRNKEAASYNKIFNLSQLVEILQMEKNKLLKKIETCNKKVDPKTYLDNRDKLQREYNILKYVDFSGDNDINKYINQLQLIFIKYIFIEKIKRSNTREQLIDCMYELRYYKFLPYNREIKIKDIDGLKSYIDQAEELLIRKMYENRIINTISTNLETDIKIVKNIFNLKIINMENIYIEIKKYDQNYIINTFDEKETLEDEKEINLEFNKRDRIKVNKKIKLFKHEK